MYYARLKFFAICLPFYFFLDSPTVAQITPDTTLGVESSVVQPNVVLNGIQSDRIDGGAIRGPNLFHSFQNFNIEAGRGAYFTNPFGVTNILTRVTGTNRSNILGTLGVLGNANLLFINPNGIVFGPNASLNLNGSFLATTASSINLADGTFFSATNPQATPLLTVSVPVGLGLGSNPGAIRVLGTGQGLSEFITSGSSLTGLRISPENTLALVGGDVALEGGTITAPQGRIEIASVGNGIVSISPTVSGWNLGYQAVQSFRNIQLSLGAFVDASGFGSGTVQVQGNRVSLTDGSRILIQNQGSQPGGQLNVHAAESVELSGKSSDGMFGSVLNNYTLGVGNAGDIAVSTKRLVIQSGGQITTGTFGAGTGGNINVRASESVELNGFLDSNRIPSAIGSRTLSSGRAGDIAISTGRLTVRDGGLLTSLTSDTGAGGNVIVNATESVEVMGVIPILFQPSFVTASTLSTGKAGNLTINTSRLVVRNGGRVDASTFASGDAGSVTVNASQSVDVSGTVPGSINPSQVTSSANIVDPVLQQALGLPAVPSGASGDVTINTLALRVTDGGLINVRNDGSGDGGTTRINARSIVLDRQGGITAATTTGVGGNISLRAQNLLALNGSTITATAGGTGNGGNLEFNTGTLTALGGSAIARRFG